MKSLHKLNRIRLPLVVRKVRGYSMMPFLPPSTTVIGLRYFRILKVDDVIIFFHEGTEKIKRIHKIENDRIYVLGDSLQDSKDSRHFGEIIKDSVIAKLIWPRPVDDDQSS